MTELTSFENETNIEGIHASLVRSGISANDATKLVLFVPTAFAREMFEPEGVTFPDQYTRTAPNRRSCQRLYRREPIFRSARALARELIHAGRFHEVDVVILWSAEGKLIKDAITNGNGRRRATITEITHHF